MMEIERKFRVKYLPDQLEQYEKKVIEQGYLCKGPVIRIRKSNNRYILTYKNKTGIIQEGAIQSQEIEVDLTEESFLHLKEKVDGNMIEKTRYLIPLSDGLTAELDVFSGKLTGLVFVEVEFKSKEEAENFQLPEWFLEDVSFDKRFRNSYLSTINDFKELGL